MPLFLFGLFLAIWIPTIVIIIWKKKTQSRWSSLLLGVAVAIITQILLEITNRINFWKHNRRETADRLSYEILQQPILYIMHSALFSIVMLSVWRMSMLHTKSLISTHKEAVMFGLGFLIAASVFLTSGDVPADPAADATFARDGILETCLPLLHGDHAPHTTSNRNSTSDLPQRTGTRPSSSLPNLVFPHCTLGHHRHGNRLSCRTLQVHNRIMDFLR